MQVLRKDATGNFDTQKVCAFLPDITQQATLIFREHAHFASNYTTGNFDLREHAHLVRKHTTSNFELGEYTRFAKGYDK